MKASVQRTMVETWLKDISTILEIELALDEEGICTIQVGDDQLIAVEVPEDFPMIYLYTPLQPVPMDDKDIAFQVISRAMEMNAFQALTRGGALAMATASSLIIYCLSLPVEGMDSEIFGKVFVQFHETALELTTLLKESLPLPKKNIKQENFPRKMIFKL